MKNAILVVALLVGAGCAGFGEYLDRATSKQIDGTIPAVTVATKTPQLVANPADVGAWIEVLKALGYIIVGSGGTVTAQKAKKVLKAAGENAAKAEAEKKGA